MNPTPTTYLRLEGGAILALSIAAYLHLDGPAWPWLLVLAPDLAIPAYGFGPRTGALLYNLAHTTLAPIGLGTIGLLLDAHHLELAALIWLAHIGFDRLLGYGLKQHSAFADTHLGRRGHKTKLDGAL